MMGLLSKIGSAVKSVGTAIKNVAVDTLKVISKVAGKTGEAVIGIANLPINPSGGVVILKDVVGKKQDTKQIEKGLKIASAEVGAFSGLAVGIGTGSIVGGIATAVGTPALLGAVSSKPELVIDTINAGTSALGSSAQFGSDVAEFSKNPTFTGATEIVKNHPLAVVSGIIASGYLGGKALSFLNTAYNSYLTSKDIRQNDKTMDTTTKTPTSPALIPSNVNTSPNPSKPLDTNTPITAPLRETTDIYAVKKRRSRSRIKQNVGVRQSVRVNVINSNRTSTSKNYLNKHLLYN